MRIDAPEYLLLLALSVLNIWAAFILAGVRARAKDDLLPLPLDPPDLRGSRPPVSQQDG